MDAAEYNADFYSFMHEAAVKSSGEVVPLIMDLVNPKSAIDVGCGVGTWLQCFKSHGVARVLGVDGPYIDSSQLVIESEEFATQDLSKAVSLDTGYDIALCLEVAEHLPRKLSGKLVSELTNSAPVVLFSAAIPGQGGTNHINEQWHCFWHRLFQEHGFACCDVLRPKVFGNFNVGWYYRQNMFLYAKGDAASTLQALLPPPKERLEVVAPRIMNQYVSTKRLLRQLPRAIIRDLRGLIEK